jgi:hypothetical protein
MARVQVCCARGLACIACTVVVVVEGCAVVKPSSITGFNLFALEHNTPIAREHGQRTS